MGKVDLEKLDTVFAEWSCQELEAEEGAVTIDGKTLRGSKRYEETALQVVTAAGQDLRKVLGQSQVQKGDYSYSRLVYKHFFQ